MNIKYSIISIAAYIILLMIIIGVIVFKRWYKLDHKNLFNQKIFWVAILFPVFSFIYFGAFSWAGHWPHLDNKGMNNFLEISKLPLLLLAAAVPLGAIVTNLHRTYQVEAQIKTAEAKNLLDGYYAHNKYYVESFGRVNINRKVIKTNIKNAEEANSLLVSISQPHTLYKKLFPLSSPVSGPQYSPSENTINQIGNLTDNILKGFDKLTEDVFIAKIKDGFDKDDEQFKDIRFNILLLCYYLCFDDSIRDLEIIDLKSANRRLCLKITMLRLTFICHKLSVALIEVLDICGVTRKSHPEIIKKVRKLRSCAKEPKNILNSIKSSMYVSPLTDTLRDVQGDYSSQGKSATAPSNASNQEKIQIVQKPDKND